MIITLVAGLPLGLKCSGSDAVRDTKYKQKKAGKITPAEKIDVIPCTDAEASGKGLIFIGDHLYLIIGGSFIYLYSRKNKLYIR